MVVYSFYSQITSLYSFTVISKVGKQICCISNATTATDLSHWLFTQHLHFLLAVCMRFVHFTLSVLYTVNQNKTPTQSFCDNFGRYGPILIILSPLHSAMNSGRNFYVICHLNSNLLPHYIVKFERSTEQPFTIVIQFKSVQSRLFLVNIYRDAMTSMTCLCRFIYKCYSTCSK